MARLLSSVLLLLIVRGLNSSPTDISFSKWLSGPMFGTKGVFDSSMFMKDGRALSKAKIFIKESENFASFRPVEKFKPCNANMISRAALDHSIDATGISSMHQAGIYGRGVIIGIYDSGIDWEHLDFRDSTGRTRVLYLWDQTIDTLDGDNLPPYSNCRFGVEYTSSQINDELEGKTSGKIRSFDYDGHGTHVAGIAAANGLARNERTPAIGYKGAAPEASLIIVKGRYGDASVNAALDYMKNRASELNMPLSVNFSFGGHSGAHDGTSLTERKIDSLFNSNASSRFIAVAAGNDNLDSIHLQKDFLSSESVWEIPFTIPSYTPHDGQYNDAVAFSFWYPGSRNNHMNVSILGPDASGEATREFGPFQFRATSPVQAELIDSLGYVEVYNATQPINNKDQIIIYIIDSIVNGRSIQPVSGKWKLRFSRTGSTTATMHGWYLTEPERYDPLSIRAHIPSGNRSHSVVVPATSKEAVTVGGFISAREWLSSTGETVNYYKKDWPYYPEFDTLPHIGSVFPQSSNGPTTDNRIKPDISAPAEAIAASKSKTLNYNVPGLFTWDTIHLVNKGTSMAAPHVAGAAALLLSINRDLNQQSLKTILTSNAKRDSYTGSLANNSWGNGKLWLHPEMLSIGHLSATNMRTKENRLTVSPNPFNPVTTLKFKALKDEMFTVSVYNVMGVLVDYFSYTAKGYKFEEVSWISSTKSNASGILTFNLKSKMREIKGKAILVR